MFDQRTLAFQVLELRRGVGTRAPLQVVHAPPAVGDCQPLRTGLTQDKVEFRGTIGMHDRENRRTYMDSGNVKHGRLVPAWQLNADHVSGTHPHGVKGTRNYTSLTADSGGRGFEDPGLGMETKARVGIHLSSSIQYGG